MARRRLLWFLCCELLVPSLCASPARGVEVFENGTKAGAESQGSRRSNATASTASTAATASSGWVPLCQEVLSLRSTAPSYVVKLGHLYEARQSLSKKRRLRLREHSDSSPLWSSNGSCVAGDGPWRLKIDLAAPSTAPPAFRKHHRVVLVFTKTWPQSLPSIRFVGQLKSLYVKPPDEDKSDHVHEASSKLLLRLQEAASGSAVACMWRQTGNCNSTHGEREPDKDRLCSENVLLGNSGFCDCNGDNRKNDDELGYDCQSTPGSCETVCPRSTPGSRYDLKWLLWQLHLSLGGALHPMDQKSWQLAAAAFEDDARTVVKYQSYGRKHDELFQTNGLVLEKAIDPRMLDLISQSWRHSSREEVKVRLMASGLIQEIVPGLVFSFPIFTLDFCALLMEEIRNFYGSKLPARRPNSMNNYGIILNEIGRWVNARLEPMIFDLQDAVIQPLASVLFPTEGSELESHHSFTIRYKGGEDTHLDVHTDDSDVTFNVNIFGNYTGAPLVFCGINGEPDHRHFRTAYQHQLGHAVLHRGRHRHGAEDITGGERMRLDQVIAMTTLNLVVWSYSYNYRHSKESVKMHLKEASKPDQRCVSYTHDRDFGRYKAWPPGKKERFMGRGWCPPRGKEYDGFVPDVPDDQLPHRSRGGQQQQ